jgi:hypothetical protein
LDEPCAPPSDEVDGVLSEAFIRSSNVSTSLGFDIFHTGSDPEFSLSPAVGGAGVGVKVGIEVGVAWGVRVDLLSV